MFKVNPAWPVNNQPKELLRVLNSIESVGELYGQRIEFENSRLAIAGRALAVNEIQKILNYWNLPDGSEQARCHIPHHAIATVHCGKIDWLAAICFQCWNISIGGTSATNNGRIISCGLGGMNHNQEFEALLNSLYNQNIS